MFATKLFFQFSNKPCLDLLVCTQLWNWNEDDNCLLVLDINLLNNRQSQCDTLPGNTQAANIAVQTTHPHFNNADKEELNGSQNTIPV